MLELVWCILLLDSRIISYVFFSASTTKPCASFRPVSVPVVHVLPVPVPAVCVQSTAVQPVPVQPVPVSTFLSSLFPYQLPHTTCYCASFQPIHSCGRFCPRSCQTHFGFSAPHFFSSTIHPPHTFIRNTINHWDRLPSYTKWVPQPFLKAALPPVSVPQCCFKDFILLPHSTGHASHLYSWKPVPWFSF